MTYQWPLQRDIVTPEDKLAMIEFLSEPAVRLTAGPRVKEFEQEWSGWNHGFSRKARSLFVQSGSAANLLLFAALIESGQLKRGDRVAMPAITWGTTLTPLILFDLEPVFIDILPETLTMDMDQLERSNPDMIWVTHLAGLANDMDDIMMFAEDLPVAEDCCQAYGAEVNGRKVGTFGHAGTSSFYFGHHMTSIEGGMLMLNTPEAGEKLISCSEAMRGHGLSREISIPAERRAAERDFDHIDNRFMFTHLPFNMRNTELNAVLGLSQLQSLDYIVTQRNRNFQRFRNLMTGWRKFDRRCSVPRELPGTRNSSFCLPLIFHDSDDRNKFAAACERTKMIETRPLAGGPLAYQPAFNRRLQPVPANGHMMDLYSRTVYIGNNHLVQDDDWPLIHKVWKEAFGE